MVSVLVEIRLALSLLDLPPRDQKAATSSRGTCLALFAVTCDVAISWFFLIWYDMSRLSADTSKVPVIVMTYDSGRFR